VSVLSAQRRYCEAHTFSDEVVTRALDLAAQKYQNLVVDLPRHAESWTDGVLLGSTSVYLVTEFSVPGLKAARRMASDIVARYGGEIKPRVIVNKYSRSLFGTSLSTNEAKDLLRDLLAGYVSAEPKLMREAIDRGIPTTDIKSRNSIVQDVARILGGQ
jgi:pilus assembly protein CpaE